MSRSSEAGALYSVQGRPESDLAWEGGQRGWRKWADARYMLEPEWTEAADGLDVKKIERAIKGDDWVFS